MQKQKLTAKQEHFIKPVSNLELNTLPEFMKSPNPQVKFQSAFPPLTTKVRVRGVYERAGFDVYKPSEKDRSLSSTHRSRSSGNLNSTHRPPNRSFSASQNSSSNSSPKKGQFRTISQNSQNSSSNTLNSPNLSLPNPRYKNSLQNPSNSSLSSKSRNFTTPNPSRGTNNSAPNLIGTFNHSPTHSNSSPTSASTKKNNIKNYAQNKLNLKTTKEKKTIEPVSNNLNLNDIPASNSDLVIPKIQLTNSNRNSMVSDHIDHNDLSFENDGLHVQQTLPINEDISHNFETERQIPKVGGPRPFQDTEETNSSGDEVPLNFHSERTQSAHIVDNVQEQQQNTPSERNSIYEPTNQLSIPDTNKLLQSPAGSTKSESSVESFDEKFMAHTNIDNEDQVEYDQNLSHETLGGLGGLRKTINSTEVEPNMIPLVPDVTSPYNQKSKRISTLSTNDMKIYNLQSLNSEDQIAMENSVNRNYTNTSYNDDFNSYPGSNQFNEMSIIQEGDSEDHTRSQNSYHTPSNRASNSGIAELPTVTVDDVSSLDDNEDALFKDAETGNILENVEPTIDSVNPITDHIISDDDQLLRRGFTKRSATAVDTPNATYDAAVSNTDNVAPPVPPLVSANNDSVESIKELINDLDNFQHSSEQIDQIDKPADEFEIPPRHFEKVTQQQQQQQQHTPVNTESFHHLQEHTHSDSNASSHLNFSHQYNSYSSYPPSVGSPVMPMSSGFTTPDQAFEEAATTPLNNSNQVYYPPGEGPCRKCGLPILEGEKKIWSKDNQLSGQWHRACFGCHECNAKFNKGSSCYVYNDQPYCERHFHELNGSLCKVCNRGVEGECLQNEVNEVFHIDCLKCVICGLNVKGDYFIFRNEVMCETDAKELMYQIEEAEKENSNKDIDKIIKRRTRVLYL